MAQALTNQAQYSSEDGTIPSIDMLAQIWEEEKIKKEEDDRQLNLLAREIESLFQTDASQRARKENEWYWAERLMLGSMFKYWNRWSVDNSDNPFDTKDANYVDGDKPEFNIVKPKIKIGQAQLEMLQFGAGTDKNFNIKAKKPVKLKSQINNQSPVFYQDGQTPMVNPQTGQPMTVGELVMSQSAADDEQARKMDEECWNQMSTVKYGEKMRLGFHDMLWYGAAVYKGPFNNNKCKKVRYKTSTTDGQPLWVSAYTEEPAPDFDRIPVWLFYPDHRALTIDDAEHATVVHIYTPTKLKKLTKLDGFRQDVIAELLQQKPAPNYYPQFRARAIQYNNSKFLDNKYVILEWHGTVGKDQLNRLGVEPPYDNPFDMYKAEIWVCQGRVIYSTLEMLESDSCLPFAVNTWESDPASLFGFGAILLRDAQRVVNMTYQMVLDNAGLCALPQVAMEKEGITPIDGKPTITPGKVWYKTDDGMGRPIGEMIEFFFPPNNLQMLTSVLSMAREFGEEESIIPLLAGGLGDASVDDAGATGMAIRMQSSTTVLSSKARQWDDNITKSVAGWFYEWNMQYSDKEDIKGDYDIDVQTSTAYLNKMIGQRDLERLNAQAAQDPDMKYLIDRTEALRAQVAGMNVPYDSIVRDKEAVEALKAKDAAAAAQAPPDPAMLKAQADLINAQAHQMSVQNDKDKLAFDAQQGLQEAQLQHEEAMANYKVRDNESVARALDAASKKDIALAQLAAKDKQSANELITELQIHDDQQQTDQFVAGVQAQQQQHKLNLEERNTAVKEETLTHKKKTTPPKARKPK